MTTRPATANFKLTVSTAEGLYFYNPEEIIRLEASSNYTYIYFTNRKPVLISKVLGDYEEILSAAGFVRTHRSHLVNKKHISFIDSYGNIYMQDDSKAELSRRKKKEVMRALAA
jgi:two-component system, LytTR family, response regulator